jgi:hypothetical protein
MKTVGIPYSMSGDRLVPPVVLWPQQCPCCGSEANTYFLLQHRAREISSTDYSRTTTTTYYQLRWNVPYCQPCKGHATISSNLLLWISLVLIFLALGVFLILLSRIDPLVLSIILILGSFAAGAVIYQIFKRLLVRSKMSSACAHDAAAINVSDDFEKLYFHFYRNDQAEMFALMNHSEALDFVHPERPKVAPTASEAIIGRYRKIFAWVGGILVGSVFLLISCIYPLDGVPGYQLITEEDFSIIFAFLFSFLVGAGVGALLGGWLGTRLGGKVAAR